MRFSGALFIPKGKSAIYLLRGVGGGEEGNIQNNIKLELAASYESQCLKQGAVIPSSHTLICDRILILVHG